MANDKKFIVKNGLQTDENVVIGSSTDNGSDRLQVTGSAKVTGKAEITQAVQATPSIKVTNSGGPSAEIAEFAGTSQSIKVINDTFGDYRIVNTGQNNGIKFYDNTVGFEILYNNTVDLSFSSLGIDFKREPTYAGNVFWNAGNDGSGSGLDADVLDGIDSLQFVRSDEDDTLDGNYTITGNLTVQGTRTEIVSETVLIADNIITLNSNFTTGTPTENAGWEVLRGGLPTSSLQWDETNDYFKLISAGTDLGRIITTADEGSGNLFDADTVDGLEAAQFLRSDADDTATGNIVIEGDLTVGDGNGTANLKLAGAGGTEYLAATGGEIGFLNNSFNFGAKLNSSGDFEVTDDILAQQFIDINDTDYKLVPSTSSILNNIELDGALQSRGDVDTNISFPSADTIGFTLGAAQLGTMNASKFEYNQQIVAQKFTDIADTNYFAKPSGLSEMHSANFYSGATTNDLNIGRNATERFNIHVTDNQGYIRYYQDETDGTDHSVNFEIVSTGLGLNRFNFNRPINLGANTITAGFGVFSSGVYSPIYYDSDNENYYGDFANTTGSLKIAGPIWAPNGTTALPSYTFDNDRDTGMYRGAANRLSFSAGNNEEMRIETTYVQALGSFRAPLFEDTDNTAYYGNFAGTSVMSQIDIDSYVRHKGNTNTYMGFPANNRQAFVTNGTERFGIQDTRADFSVNVYAPRYYDSGDNNYYLDPAADSELNTINLDDYIQHRGDLNTRFGFQSNDIFAIDTNGVTRFTVGNSAVSSALDVYAPTYFTNDYLIHNNDTNTYIGFDANDQFGVWTGGTKQINVTTTKIDFNLDTDVNGTLDVTGRAKIGNSLTRPDSLADLSDSAAKIGGSDVHLHIASLSAVGNYAVAIQAGRESDDANFELALNPNGGFVGIGDVNPTSPLSVRQEAAMGNNPFAASNRLQDWGDGGADFRLAGDASGNAYLINDNNFVIYDEGASGKFAVLSSGDVIVNNDSTTYTASDATPAIGTIEDNKLHVSGSVSLAGDNDALVLGNGTSSYFKNNDLGFGQGGGFYMDEATTIKIRGNKNIYTTGNITGAAFYDSADANYFVNPAGDSQMNTIDIDDYIRHRGDTNTYIGFSAADKFKIFTGGTQRVNIDNDSANFAQNVYAPRYYDSNDNNYYVDPAGDSIMNTIVLDDYIQHKGNTDAYFGWAGNNNFKLFTNGTERFNVDANSADFSINVYAPRYYDSNDNLYYLDPASVSKVNNVSFGNPGNGANTKGRFLSIEGNTDTGGEGSARIFFAEHNSTTASQDRYGVALAYRGGAATVNSVTGQPVTLTGLSNGEWGLIGYNNSVNGNWAMKGSRDSNYVTARGSFRAPIFYDSANTNYYGDFASTSVMNVVRSNQLQLDGSTYTIDSPSGDYGSIRVGGAKGGWYGYAIQDDWVFMANGSSEMGLYNDTRNEWALKAYDNNRTVLYSNGAEQLSAENGYAKAFNSMRSPVYYPPSGTSRLLDLDAANTATSLKIGGQILREGMNTSGGGSDNKFLVGQDANHWLWNTATDWGIFWATNTSASYRWSNFGDNMLSFVGNGNLRAAIDLDNGDGYFEGELTAGNFALNAGNENISLNPSYGVGKSELKLFDGAKYWEKRAINALQGNEDSPTGTTAEYVKSTDAPAPSSYVLRSAAYRTFYSDMIEVEPGEELYGEMYVKVISGSGGRFYYGVERYDKDKKPIAGNTGTTYFVAGGATTTSTSWQKFSGYTTVPTTHTVFSGSDGGGCRYVRIRILMNYPSGGALREFTPPILTRTKVSSKLRSNDGMFSPRFYDLDDENFYLDPASTSKLNVVDASNFRDKDNTARFMNPATGGNVQGTWNWNNGTISNLNNLTFADPGVNEGIKWVGGNEWQIYESPNNQTNAGGNLQFTSGAGNGTMRGRIDSSGDVWAGRYMRAQRFYDSNDGTFYADPASTSIQNSIELRNGGLKLKRAETNNAIWFNAGADTNHVLWNHHHGGPTTRGAGGSGGFDGIKWNTYAGIHLRGGGAGAYNLAKFHTTGSGSGNAHYVQLYANNVEQLGTRGGYGYAPNSMRSPLFYDQDDTTYYGNFAGTSRMNVINANMYSLNDGWDFYDDNGETLNIRSNNGDHGSIIFRDSGGTDCGRIYFDDDNHFGLKTPANEWGIYIENNARVYTYYNGTWEERTASGYMEARGSYRAPIFYDSNDTAWYANPNATSRFRDLTVNGVINAPGVTGYAGSITSKDNRIIEPNEDSASQLKFGFTSWNNNNTAPYADYLHLRSYGDASGGSDNLLMFKKSGRGMRLWQQSWNSGTAYSAYSDLAIYNANPGGGASSSFYASRFYDSDNTARYLDPGSRSQLNDVTINGGNDLTFTTSSGTARGFIQATETNDQHLIIATSGGEDIAFKDGGLSGQRNFLIRGDGNTFTTGTHYAQRFTDSNNGNYYGDFASTSVMSVVDVRSEVYNDGWFRNDTSGRGLYSTPHAMHWMATANDTWRAYSTANTARINLHTSGNNRRGTFYANNNNEVGILSQDDGWALQTTNSKVDSHHNFYAPIMYDRNSTGYYANPAGQSHFNTLTLAGNRIGFVNSSFDAEIRVSDANPDGTGAQFIFYGDTVAYNAEVASEVFRATRHMRAGRYYDIDNSTFFVEGASTSYFNSIQADILYDRNNTAYYFNGASTNSTRFEGVSNRTKAQISLSGQTRSSAESFMRRPNYTGDTNYWVGSMGWGRQDMTGTVANWGSGFIDSWSNPPNQPSGTSHWVGTQAYHYSNGSSRYGWQMVGGPIENLRFRSTWGGFRSWRTIPVLGVNNGNAAAMYASIYYDANNTGYYCDPSSFSNLNSGVRATEFYARNWFRNDNAREGMYNQATGGHLYSYQGQYWAATGNNNGSSMSFQLRAANNGTMCRWMYGDRTWSGDLNAAGQWQFQTRHQDGYSPSLRFIESGNESWTGNIGNDGGKLEYHSNRFYLESGGNSSLIVQFRRNGSNRSYIDNNGLYVGTATSARWADLAERYTADDMYDNATVLGVNLDGDSEATLWQPGMPLLGVISTNPAVQMNDMGIAPGSNSKKARMNPFIALKGRIPCKVSEDVKKGQWVIPAGDGMAKGVDYGTPGINSYEIIGIALADSANGEVEVKV